VRCDLKVSLGCSAFITAEKTKAQFVDSRTVWTSPNLRLPPGFLPAAPSRVKTQSRGLKMATWKRLTDTNQRKIDVNIDSIAYLHPFEKHTSIHFIGGEARINVRETPDQIHLADPLRHK
jgi:hypothetical protein